MLSLAPQSEAGPSQTKSSPGAPSPSQPRQGGLRSPAVTRPGPPSMPTPYWGGGEYLAGSLRYRWPSPFVLLGPVQTKT